MTANDSGAKRAQRSVDKLAQAPIAAEFVAFFKNQGIKASVIYRTCSADFPAGEWPHNFVPKRKGKDTLRIFVDYKSRPISLDNAERIYACPGHLIDTLPRQKVVRLKSGQANPDKVDFGKVPDKFKFRNWADLRAEWRTMWE